MSDDDQQVVTEAIWRPGLPPRIEALQVQFPPEDGYTIEYGTRLERDEREPDGWRRSQATSAGTQAVAAIFERMSDRRLGRVRGSLRLQISGR